MMDALQQGRRLLCTDVGRLLALAFGSFAVEVRCLLRWVSDRLEGANTLGSRSGVLEGEEQLQAYMGRIWRSRTEA